MNTTLTLVDLGGAIALLIWGVHMVQTGLVRIRGRIFFALILGRGGTDGSKTPRWRKPDSNSQSHLNEKPFLGR